MKSTYVLLLFIGIILITANRATETNKGKTPVHTKVKYIPRDLDTYIREDLRQPSLLYGAMFTERDVIS